MRRQLTDPGDLPTDLPTTTGALDNGSGLRERRHTKRRDGQHLRSVYDLTEENELAVLADEAADESRGVIGSLLRGLLAALTCLELALLRRS